MKRCALPTWRSAPRFGFTVAAMAAALLLGAGSWHVGHTPVVEAQNPCTNYYSSQSPPRDVGWRPCNMTTYQQNISYIAFNNWVSRFGHSTTHTKLLSSCSVDSNLRVWGRNPANTQAFCGDPGDIACFAPQYVDIVGLGDQIRVYRAYIVFDYVYFDGLWDAGPQMHIIAHEFGHGMGLADPHACGESVMSGSSAAFPCTDMVDNGPYPNDVCVPDSKMGYGSGRC